MAFIDSRQQIKKRRKRLIAAFKNACHNPSRRAGQSDYRFLFDTNNKNVIIGELRNGNRTLRSHQALKLFNRDITIEVKQDDGRLLLQESG